jgi:hypothetical protein
MKPSRHPDGRPATIGAAIESRQLAYPTLGVHQVIALQDGKRILMCHELAPEEPADGRRASVARGAMALDLISLEADDRWELVDRIVPPRTGWIEDLVLLDGNTVLVNEMLRGPRLWLVRVTPSGLRATNSIDIDTIKGCRADECYLNAYRLDNGYVCVDGPWSYHAFPLMLELQVDQNLQLQVGRSGVVDCRPLGDTRAIDDDTAIQEEWAGLFANVGKEHCIGISKDETRLVLRAIRVLGQDLLIEPIQELHAEGTWSVGSPWYRPRDDVIPAWDSGRGLVMFRWDGRRLVEDQVIPWPTGLIAKALIGAGDHAFLCLAPPRSGWTSPEHCIAAVDWTLGVMRTRWVGSGIYWHSPSWMVSLAAGEDHLIARSLTKNSEGEVLIRLPLTPQFWNGVRRFTWSIHFVSEHVLLLNREHQCFVVDLTSFRG